MSTHSADASPERAAKRLKVDDSPSQIVDAPANGTDVGVQANGNTTAEAVPAAAEKPASDETNAVKPEEIVVQPEVAAAIPSDTNDGKDTIQPEVTTETTAAPATSAAPPKAKPVPAKVDARDSGRAPVKAE